VSKLDDEVEFVDQTINEEGKEVWRYKYGEMKIKVTFLNNPSPEAIKNTNTAYNELFHKFNPPENP
jgi:hypothetical protein